MKALINSAFFILERMMQMSALLNIPPQWSSLVNTIAAVIAIIAGFITIKKTMKASNEAAQKRSDEHTKEIAEKLFAKSNEDNMAMQASLQSLDKTIAHLSGVIDSFKISENQHYEDHEKHLMQTDLEIQKNDDAIDDHENRIKSNEDDIDYLKKQVGGNKNG